MSSEPCGRRWAGYPQIAQEVDAEKAARLQEQSRQAQTELRRTHAESEHRRVASAKEAAERRWAAAVAERRLQEEQQLLRHLDMPAEYRELASSIEPSHCDLMARRSDTYASASRARCSLSPLQPMALHQEAAAPRFLFRRSAAEEASRPRPPHIARPAWDTVQPLLSDDFYPFLSGGFYGERLHEAVARGPQPRTGRAAASPERQRCDGSGSGSDGAGPGTSASPAGEGDATPARAGSPPRRRRRRSPRKAKAAADLSRAELMQARNAIYAAQEAGVAQPERFADCITDCLPLSRLLLRGIQGDTSRRYEERRLAPPEAFEPFQALPLSESSG